MTEPSTLPAVPLDVRPIDGDPAQQQDNAEPLLAPPTKREREAAWMQAALEVSDLASVPTAELRVTANRMYWLMDADRPPHGAVERYEAVVAEIETRIARARRPGAAARSREVFKDSAYNSRFELYCDGMLAAYVRYSIHEGELRLRTLVEKPEFEGRGLWQGLVREAMLSAHKRRLSVSPGCPAARAFLRQHPQYLALTRSAH